MTQKLTEWFVLSEQKPWDVGVYEVQGSLLFGTPLYSYWDGQAFKYISYGRKDVALNMRNEGGGGSYVNSWRGLFTNPATPKPRGNRKVTRYVVQDEGVCVAVYADHALAEKHRKRLRYGRVKTIRFRSPEAA